MSDHDIHSIAHEITTTAKSHSQGLVTSAMAAEWLNRIGAVPALAALFYDYGITRPDRKATEEQASLALGKQRTSMSPRIGDLRRPGLIYDSGETKTNSSGQQAIVWVFVRGDDEEGRAKALAQYKEFLWYKEVREIHISGTLMKGMKGDDVVFLMKNGKWTKHAKDAGELWQDVRG